jgi:hypothetical protein
VSRDDLVTLVFQAEIPGYKEAGTVEISRDIRRDAFTTMNTVTITLESGMS